MTDQMQQIDPRDEPGLPRQLVEDLTELYRPPAGVPQELDDEIIHAARRQFGDTRRSRLWGGLGLTAAAVLIVFLMQQLLQPTSRPSAPAVRSPLFLVSRQDIDHNGRVDILDAFTLARRIESGATSAGESDVNGDGRVDQADVDAVAMAAVQLSGGAS